MTINFKINLTNSQKEALDLINNDNYKFYTLVWSRQSGKSTLMKILCVIWLFEKNRSIGYVTKNYILAKKLYKDVINLLPKEYIQSSNGSDLTLTTTFNSTLTFFSAESGSSLRGQTFDYLICDEFAFSKLEQTDGSNLWFDILFPTIKVKGKKIIFVSTPLGKNNVFYEMYLNGIKPEMRNYISLKKDIYSDGLISEKEIEEIKRSIPELSFKQEFLCEFIEGGNSFFKDYDQCFIDFHNKYQEDKVWIGIDLSGNGEDETILTKINSNDKVQQIVIKGSLDSKYKQIADIINNQNGLVGCFIENNGLGAPMINEIRKLCKGKLTKIFDFHTNNTNKEEIISNLAVKIANNDIYFDKENVDLLEQFSNFIVTFSKSRKLVFNAKQGKHDDRIMSLAIALECKNKLKASSATPFLITQRLNKIR